MTNFARVVRPSDGLREGGTGQQTVGCRLTNPNTCLKNALPSVCAFARKDGMCLSPPANWLKQYKRLAGLGDEGLVIPNQAL